ncbi:MAG: tetratricopeptide repeat protein [bacterium]
MKRVFYVLLCGIMVSCVAPQTFAQSMEMTSAKLYIQQNEWDKAIHWLEEALKKKQDNAEAHFLLAQGYGQKARFADMIKEFNATEQYDKKGKYAKDLQNFRQRYFAESFNAGVKAFNEQNFEAAADKFSTAATLDPTQIASYQNLTVAYRQVENDIEAGAPCEGCSTGEHEWDAAAVRCRDQSTGAYTKFCCCKDAKDQLANAIASTYQTLIKMQPDSMMNYLALADYYKSKKQFDKSATVLAEAVPKHPNDARLLAELAITYDYLGKSDEAFKMYEQALVNKPDDKDLLFNYGRLYLMREDYDNAIVQFQKVVEVTPEDFEANYNVGISHLKIGERLDKQMREMDDAANKNKQKPDTQKLADLKATAKQHFDAAVPYLEKAANIKGEQSAVWFNLGVGYTRVGNAEKAKEAFAKAEELEKQQQN